MIQEESIQIGAFRLRTENYQEEGIFTSASNEEMKGVSYSFILDGASNYSFVIKLIQFEDSTASVGLDGLYTGPRFIYSNLYSRLRLGISTNNHISSAEIRVPKLSKNKANRFTAHKVTKEELDSSFRVNNVEEFLKSYGVKDIDTKGVLFNDASNRKGYIAATWDERNLISPIVLFVVTRLVPLMHELLNIPNAKDDVVFYGPNKTLNNLTLNSLLVKDENSDLEFKSSMFFSHDEKTYGDSVTHDIERTVVGMLNGVTSAHLLIGIGSDGSKLGVSNDFKYLKKQNWDDYLLKVRNHFINLLGIGIVTTNINIGWHDIGEGIENPVVDISIQPIPYDFDLVKDRNGHVWIRTLNATQRPHTKDEYEEYLNLRKISLNN